MSETRLLFSVVCLVVLAMYEPGPRFSCVVVREYKSREVSAGMSSKFFWSGESETSHSPNDTRSSKGNNYYGVHTYTLYYKVISPARV